MEAEMSSKACWEGAVSWTVAVVAVGAGGGAGGGAPDGAVLAGVRGRASIDAERRNLLIISEKRTRWGGTSWSPRARKIGRAHV